MRYRVQTNTIFPRFTVTHGDRRFDVPASHAFLSGIRRSVLEFATDVATLTTGGQMTDCAEWLPDPWVRERVSRRGDWPATESDSPTTSGTNQFSLSSSLAVLGCARTDWIGWLVSLCVIPLVARLDKRRRSRCGSWLWLWRHLCVRTVGYGAV